MRPEADDLHHAADGALLDQLPGAHGAFHVQPLAEIDHVFPAGRLHLGARGGELVERGEGRLVGEIVLAGIHHAQAERAALAGHGGGGHEQDLRLFQHGFEARQRFDAGEGRAEFLDLRRVGIEDVFELAARLGQTAALAIDVAVVERHGGEREFALFDDRRGFALGRVVHAIGFLVCHRGGKIGASRRRCRARKQGIGGAEWPLANRRAFPLPSDAEWIRFRPF